MPAEALAKAGSFGGFRRSFDRCHGCHAVALHRQACFALIIRDRVETLARLFSGLGRGPMDPTGSTALFDPSATILARMDPLSPDDHARGG